MMPEDHQDREERQTEFSNTKLRPKRPNILQTGWTALGHHIVLSNENETF